MKLYVMIATAGRSALLERTLENLANCEKPECYEGLLLVENGDSPDADQLVQSYASSLNAQYLYEPVGNKNMALNRGLREIDEGLVVLYDDDVRIDANSLIAYADAAAHWPDAPFLGGACACDYVEPPATHVLPLLPMSARGWAKDQDGAEIDDAGAMGFNWAVRPELIRVLGGFAEDRGPGTAICVGDETEMQRRLIEAYGPGRFVRDAKVWHHVPPERCSEAWLINRSYHIGVARAMALRSSADPPGIPWAVRRRRWSALCKVLIMSIFGSNQRRFRARYYRELHRGVAAGYALPAPGRQARIQD